MSVDEMIDRILGEGQDIESKPRLQKTNAGARFFYGTQRSKADGEAHHAQVLAILAESGVPLERRIRVGQGWMKFEDLVADCKATYLSDGEFEWAATAIFAATRCKSFANRQGVRFTINDVCDSLLKRPIGQGSCGGFHVLDAVCKLEQLDARYRLGMTATVRAAVRERSNRVRDFLMVTPREDGGYCANWSLGIEDWKAGVRPASQAEPGDVKSRLLVTSHAIEWLLAYHAPMESMDDVMVDAAKYLSIQCRELCSQLPPHELNLLYCQLTHAFHVLSLLSSIPS